MGQTPRHVDQDTLDNTNNAWYWKGWFNGFAIGASIVAVVALILVMVIF